jgi:hypothetical protein
MSLATETIASPPARRSKLFLNSAGRAASAGEKYSTRSFSYWRFVVVCGANYAHFVATGIVHA